MDPAVEEAPKPGGMAPTSVILAACMLIAGTIIFLWFAAEPYTYNIYKALHVVTILVWVGGDVTLTTLGIVFERRRDGAALGELGKMGGWIGTRVYTPTLFAAFALGVALIEKGNWGWGHFWIDFAIVGWALAAAVGIMFVGPEFERIGKDAATYGPDSPQVARRVKRLFTVFRFDTALLILITLDMVAKPSF
jgi:uncharacterized membrane protein